MKTIQKVIVGSMVERGFIDSARQMTAIEAVERFNDDGLTVRTLKRWGDAN